MLFDIVVRRWSPELCDLFGIPQGSLPEVHPSCGRLGRVAATVLGSDSPLAGVPISGMAGDQHAALFGQACFDPGMTKATIGTGTFVLMNAGPVAPNPVDGLITTLAWDLGTDGDLAIRADGGGGPPGGAVLPGPTVLPGPVRADQASQPDRPWPTPSRDRCSSREPACSGCGTAWA